jgi:dTDP-4-dehydrorhamnose reductase
VIINLIDAKKYGVCRATCEGECTWFEFASKIFELSNIDVNVEPCTSKEFIQTAKRPSYSVLESKNLKQSLKYTLPDWQYALEDFMKGMTS